MLKTLFAISRTIFNLLKKVITAHDEAVVKAHTTELDFKLAEVSREVKEVTKDTDKHTQALDVVINKLAMLEAQQKHIHPYIQNPQDYVLVNMGAGKLAYKYQPAGEKVDAPHYLCQPCFSRGKKIALQGMGREGNYECPVCKTRYITNPFDVTVARNTLSKP